jgi:hypothetical protein
MSEEPFNPCPELGKVWDGDAEACVDTKLYAENLRSPPTDKCQEAIEEWLEDLFQIGFQTNLTIWWCVARDKNDPKARFSDFFDIYGGPYNPNWDLNAVLDPNNKGANMHMKKLFLSANTEKTYRQYWTEKDKTFNEELITYKVFMKDITMAPPPPWNAGNTNDCDSFSNGRPWPQIVGYQWLKDNGHVKQFWWEVNPPVQGGKSKKRRYTKNRRNNKKTKKNRRKHKKNKQ